MLTQFSRTELLLGKKSMEVLSSSHVAIFGIGGVGSYTVEALVRSGVGRFSLFDDDLVCLTNLNRQLIATRKTVGTSKIEVMKQRILDINPKAEVFNYDIFFTSENADDVDFKAFDYIVDAIDTVSSKLILIEKATELNIPIISCMGAGNKLDASAFQVADIYETSICPLAKVMRKELKRRNIPKLKVVYSKETPIIPVETDDISCKNNCICPPDTKRNCNVRRQVPGSVAFVPSVAGLILAGEVIKDLSFSKYSIFQNNR